MGARVRQQSYAREQLEWGWGIKLMTELKLMRDVGWFSSTSVVVDAMSLLRSDERDAREASQWIEGVDFLKEKRENRDKKNVKEKGSARGSTEQKSQSRIKGTNKIRGGGRKLTRRTRRRVDSRESANVP